jgi:hypothetical protein
MNSIDLFVNNFKCGVGLAHETLTQKVNTMPHMARLDVDSKIILSQFLSSCSRVMVRPKGTSQSHLQTVSEDSLFKWSFQIPSSAAGGTQRRSIL